MQEGHPYDLRSRDRAVLDFIRSCDDSSDEMSDSHAELEASNCTGLKWQFVNATSPTYLYDTKLPFGAAKSPQIFQRLSSAVCRILQKEYGYTAIAYYGSPFRTYQKIFLNLI